MQIFAEADHMPPAFSQSALVRYFDIGLPEPDGLAEGELPVVPGVLWVPPDEPFPPEGLLLGGFVPPAPPPL
jgi:hypothetical protein